MDVETAPFARLSSLMRCMAYGAAELSDSLWALRDVSFTVQQGDVVGIIGAQWCGQKHLAQDFLANDWLRSAMDTKLARFRSRRMR